LPLIVAAVLERLGKNKANSTGKTREKVKGKK